MKTNKLLLKFIFLLITFFSFSRNIDYSKNRTKQVYVKKRGAPCAASTNKLIMDYNNVGALIETSGLLFLNRENGKGNYEIPKGSGISAIFTAALWIGGVDANNQLKLAAQKFRSRGNDFWPGPLSVTDNQKNDYDPNIPKDKNQIRMSGSAEISAEQCKTYDKFFTIRRAEVVEFIKWMYCKSTKEDCTSPSNDVLNRIYTWPAHGDISLGQDYYLAPFKDVDNNGKYEPLKGDYPWYDDLGTLNDINCSTDRRVSLYGDETHWWVFNDKGNTHTESGGEPIGIEIRAQAFCFKSEDSDLNNTTFYNYELINRSNQTLKNTYISQYTDPDLGNPSDDYVGCDVTRGLGYVYNGDNYDQDYNNVFGYGTNPPAVGVDFFEGPFQDADGLDNIGPKYVNKNWVIPTVSEAIQNNGIVYFGLGSGYNDGFIDNERFGMKSFSYYSGDGLQSQSDPEFAEQYYNYMNGKWRYGDEMVYGGTGFPGSKESTSIKTNYMFPGDSDTLNWSTFGVNPGSKVWSEKSNYNAPGDRRFVQSSGAFTLHPGAVNNITIGVVWARSNEGDQSIAALKRADTKIQDFFNSCFEVYDGKKFRNDEDLKKLNLEQKKNNFNLIVYPNPSSNFIKIKTPVYEDFNISIFNLEGKRIYDERYTDKNEVLINTSNFNEGIYQLVLYNDKIKLSKKISILR